MVHVINFKCVCGVAIPTSSILPTLLTTSSPTLIVL